MLDPTARPQVVIGFEEDFDLPALRSQVDVKLLVGPSYELSITPRSVVFFVGDLARHVMHVNYPPDRNDDWSQRQLPNYARWPRHEVPADFVALPKVTVDGEVADSRALALIEHEARRADMARAVVETWEMGDDRTLLWDPAVGTLRVGRGQAAASVARADGAPADSAADPAMRAAVITHLCAALAGCRRYAGRSKINLARYSLLIAELVRRRGLKREPGDGLSDGSVLERLATFLGAGHHLSMALGLPVADSFGHELPRRARAACFHLVDAVRVDGTVVDVRAISQVVESADADAAAMEYGWSFGIAPAWMPAERQELARRAAAARAKLKREPSALDENAGRHLAGLLVLADSATKAPVDLLREALADHPLTSVAVDL